MQCSATLWICMPTVGPSLKSGLFWTCLHIKGWSNKAGVVQQRLDLLISHWIIWGQTENLNELVSNGIKTGWKVTINFSGQSLAQLKSASLHVCLFLLAVSFSDIHTAPSSSSSQRKRKMKRQLLNKWPSGRNCTGNQWAISHWECLLCSLLVSDTDPTST